MLGSNPSADSVASTDRGGMPLHPFSITCRWSPLIGTGTKAPNPGGCGGKAPAAGHHPELSSHQTAGAFSFSIAMRRDRTAPAPHIASPF